jgi:D-arginine dehydrogenase
MSVSESDVVVIGGGMAGAAVAAHLSEHARVQVLEMEEHPGFHSTGRSAALFAEDYGNAAIQALTRASRDFLFNPPMDFTETALVHPRPVLIVARDHQIEAFERYRAGLNPGAAAKELTPAEAIDRFPILRPEGLARALIVDGAADIEVHELQQGYLRLLKRRGGSIATSSEVIGLKREADEWVIKTHAGEYRAPVVINAAGAWAGSIAAMAGALDIGLTPCQRTAVLVDAPAGYETQTWPMLLDVEEQFYIKPDAGLLLLSPADETPVPAGDVQPDELDIAIAVDRAMTATTLEVRQIRQKWAGLRSFVADRSPVVGYDPIQPGFFWLAALGGYGIQTAPALSEFAAKLVLGDSAAAESRAGLCAAELGPARLQLSKVGQV